MTRLEKGKGIQQINILLKYDPAYMLLKPES